MAAPTSSPQSEALASFVSFLGKARSVTGEINAPVNVMESFQSIFSAKTAIDAVDLEPLVSTVDFDDGSFFKRLGQRTTHLFSGILRLSPDCPSQQRGYCMLAEHLYEDTANAHSPTSSVNQKKTLLGCRDTITSLNRFLDTGRSYQARRAFGFFVFTLISGNQANKEQLKKRCSDEAWSSLGNIVLRQESEIIKLLAGSIIREMLEYDVPEEKFWPVQDTPAATVKSFPRNPHHTSQWVWAFHSYLEEDAPYNTVAERLHVSTFAHMIRFPDVTFEMEEESSILVTVNTMSMLSIMIPATPARAIIYLDVPFDRISEISPIKSDSQPRSQGRSPHSQSQTMVPCCLEINLSNQQGWSHLVNAKTRQADSIAMVFDYPDDAKAISQALLAQKSIPFQTVSPGDLEYERMDLPTEASVLVSDPVDASLNRQDDDVGGGAGFGLQQLTSIAFDAVSCLVEDDIDNGSKGGVDNVEVSHARETAPRIVPQSLRAEDQPHLNRLQSSENLDGATAPSNHDINVGRTRASVQSPLERKAKAFVENGASDSAFKSRDTHNTRHPRGQATHSPGPSLVQQQASDYDSMYDASPQVPKDKRIQLTTPTPVVRGLDESRQSELSRQASTKLSRQLRDQNGRVADADDNTGEKPVTHPNRQLKQPSLGQGRSSTTNKLETSTLGKSRKIAMEARASGQRGKASQMPSRDDEHEPKTVSTRAREAPGVNQAPEATMVAASRKREPQKKEPRPSITSNTSRPRPKAKAQLDGATERSRALKAKEQCPAAHEEDVNWSEDLQSDYSNNVTTKKKSKPQPRGLPAKSHKGKSIPARQSATVPKESTTDVQLPKPKRAAAIKASNKILGLTDNVDKGRPIGKGASKQATKATLASKVATLKAIPGDPGEESSLVKEASTKSNTYVPTHGPKARRPAANVKRPHEPLNAARPTQQPSSSNMEDKPLRPVVPHLATKEASDPTAKGGSEPNGPGRADHALLDKTAKDTTTADTDTEVPFEQAITDDYTKSVEEHSPTDAVNFEPLPDLGNNESAGSPPMGQMPPHLDEQGKVPNDMTGKTDDAVRSIQVEEHNNPAPPRMQHVDVVSITSGQTSGSGAKPALDDALNSLENMVEVELPKPQNYPVTTEPQSYKANTNRHAPKLKETDKQQQPAIDGERRAPPAPTKQRSTASILQEALGPVAVLQTHRAPEDPASNTQVIDREGRLKEKHVRARAKDANAVPHLRSGSKLQVKQKRQLEDNDTREAKKSRASGWRISNGPVHTSSVTHTPENNQRPVNRKPKLVHFDSTGPKNQGTHSSKKTKASTDSGLHASRRDLHLALARSSKRKHISLADDKRVAVDSAPYEKRRKMDDMRPRLIQDDGPTVQSQKPSVPSATTRPGKHGSQSSRVDEHGSPMPFHHSRQTSLVVPRVACPETERSAAPHNNSDEDYNSLSFQMNDMEMSEPNLPVVPHNTRPPIPESKAILASNTKHRPSSPNAPSSIITDMAAHQLQSSGHFIGIQTNSVIVPSKPQDPFTDTAEDRPNNRFMDILRKSSNMQSKEEKRSNGEHHREGVPVRDRQNDDLEKTLIGESLSQDERESSTASGSNSSSHSSESQPQADAEPSDDDSDSGSDWLKALRADQRETFDALCEINHQLVRDLIDKETAITDLVNDYRRGGNMRVDHFESEREEGFKLLAAKTGKAKGDLLEAFRSAEEICTTQAMESRKDVAGLRSNLEAKQRKMNASIEAALLVCS